MSNRDRLCEPYNEPVVEYIRERCSFIAPIAVYPGENELEALVTNALVVRFFLLGS